MRVPRARGARDGGADRPTPRERRTEASATRPRTGTMTPIRALLRRRLLLTVLVFGAAGAGRGASPAPLVGSTHVSLRRVFDRPSRSATTPTRRSSSSRACRARWRRRSSAPRWPRRASCSRRCCATRWRRRSRSASRPAPRSARCWRSRSRIPLALAGLSTVPLASFAGALGAVGIVYFLATVRRRGPVDERAAAGGHHAQLVLLVAHPLRAVPRRLLADVPHGPLADGRPGRRRLPARSSPRCRSPSPAFAVFAWLPRSLNVLTLGADAAAARGVDVMRVQRLSFFSASLATGAAVSLGGPVGFIGIIVPHLVRLLVGSDHRVVLPASALFGAAFLVACDVAARSVMAPMELPVGVLTAMIGGPFFLWLLDPQGVTRSRRAGDHRELVGQASRLSFCDLAGSSILAICRHAAATLLLRSCRLPPPGARRLRARQPAVQHAGSSAAARRLARPRRDRDAVRHRRRAAGRRRQQLRPLASRSEQADSRRRPARSRHRADHLAPAGPA